MTELATKTDYGAVTEPATIKIQRRLPGPIERVWKYLTESDLRRQWLAAGSMEMLVDAPFEFVWHNDELTNPPGLRPAGFPDEHRMQSSIIEVDPPRKLSFAWPPKGEVSFELKLDGDEVLLTLTHRRISDRANMVKIGAGWHMHLDVLVARVSNMQPEPFWDGWSRLRSEYEQRIPV